ncbi:MAG: septum site-determining protein MinC [Clostridia bacterium]
MITLKGTKEGITIQLTPGLTLEEARKLLADKLSQAGDFFRGATVTIRLEAKDFSAFEQYLLKTEIERLLSQSAVTFSDPPSEPEAGSEAQEEQASATGAEAEGTADVPQGADVFYRGTVRSGQVLRAAGNLVVLGDANPGSELIAGGNIVVMGTARGMLWAGAFGDRGAVVSAARLLPSQIRIAGVISRRPDGESDPGAFCPEFAEIRDNRIYIERKGLSH